MFRLLWPKDPKMSRMPTTLTSSMSKMTSSPSSGSLAKYWEGPPVRYISGTVKREISPWPRSWGHKYVQLLLGHAPWTTQTHIYYTMIDTHVYFPTICNLHILTHYQTATLSLSLFLKLPLSQVISRHAWHHQPIDMYLKTLKNLRE